MYILFDDNNRVLEITKSLIVDNNYIIIHRNGTKVRYIDSQINTAVISEEDITCSTDVPMIYDGEKVIQDPDYTPPTEDGSGDNTPDDSDEEKPMTVTEMRTKIKELEEQLAATKILLGVE